MKALKQSFVIEDKDLKIKVKINHHQKVMAIEPWEFKAERKFWFAGKATQRNIDNWKKIASMIVKACDEMEQLL